MADQAQKAPAKGIYQHFKGAFYEVLGIAEDPETGRRYVVYEALGFMENLLGADPENHFYPQPGVTSTPTKGELAVCSIARFTDLIDDKEYSKGKQVPRFRLISLASSR